MMYVNDPIAYYSDFTGMPADVIRSRFAGVERNRSAPPPRPVAPAPQRARPTEPTPAASSKPRAAAPPTTKTTKAQPTIQQPTTKGAPIMMSVEQAYANLRTIADNPRASAQDRRIARELLPVARAACLERAASRGSRTGGTNDVDRMVSLATSVDVTLAEREQAKSVLEMLAKSGDKTTREAARAGLTRVASVARLDAQMGTHLGGVVHKGTRTIMSAMTPEQAREELSRRACA